MRTTPRIRRRCCAPSARARCCDAPGGEREMPVEELIVGPLRDVARPDELLTEVRVAAGTERAAYRKFRSRSREDRPCVGVAAVVREGRLRVVVGAVAGRPAALRRRVRPRATEPRESAARYAERDRPDRRRPRLGRVPPARDRGRGAARARGARLGLVEPRDRHRPGALRGRRRAAGDAARAHRPLAVPARAHRLASTPRPCLTGVVALTARTTCATSPLYGCQIADQTVLAVDRVRHVGDPVGAVAAATPRARRRPRSPRSRSSTRSCPPSSTRSRPRAPGAPLVHDAHRISDNQAAYFGMRPQPGTNVCHAFRIRSRRRRRGAGCRPTSSSSATFRIARRAARGDGAARFAWLRWDGDRLDGLRRARRRRSTCAATSPRSSVSARKTCASSCPPMGGSFGAKTFVAARGDRRRARAQGGPAGEARCCRGAEEWVDAQPPPGRRARRARRARDGTLVAKRVDLVDRHRRLRRLRARRGAEDGLLGRRPVPDPGTCEVDSRCVYTNLPPNGAFRGYGATQVVWASERAMDVLADRLGLDPLELRLRNLLRDGDVFATGETMHDVRFEECLDAAAAARAAGTRAASGKGLCVLLKGMQTPSRASIAVEREGDGLRRSAARRPRWGRARARRCAGSPPSCSASTSARVAFPRSRTPTPCRTTRARPRAARPT